jgi:uncharacterized protein YkwD
VRRILAAVLVSVSLGVAVPASAADDPYAALLAPVGTCGPAESAPSLGRSAAQFVMRCLTNYARTHAGLRPLSPSRALNDAGAAKLAADLTCGVFSHDPCGKPFAAVFAAYLHGAAGYQIGENLAWGTGALGTPRQIMNAWLHSSGHRENILTPAFTELGIGYLPNQRFLGSTGTSLWSQEFGTRSPARTPVKTKP